MTVFEVPSFLYYVSLPAHAQLLLWHLLRFFFYQVQIDVALLFFFSCNHMYLQAAAQSFLYGQDVLGDMFE